MPNPNIKDRKPNIEPRHSVLGIPAVSNGGGIDECFKCSPFEHPHRNIYEFVKNKIPATKAGYASSVTITGSPATYTELLSLILNAPFTNYAFLSRRFAFTAKQVHEFMIKYSSGTSKQVGELSVLNREGMNIFPVQDGADIFMMRFDIMFGLWSPGIDCVHRLDSWEPDSVLFYNTSYQSSLAA